jgi:hypothetical protein
MRALTFTPQAFAFIVATRAALGFGLGLLLSSKIKRARRRSLGVALTAVGVATTIPAALMALGRVGVPRPRAIEPAEGAV